MIRVIDEGDFRLVKLSSEQVKDNKQEWRADLIEFINNETADTDDEFFFDMMVAIRFLDVPAKEAAGYTTPDKRICLNAPRGFNIGESKPKWNFIYCHECLHQLWDTFAVGDKIKQTLGEYDHELLNIASDCVINDYLHSARGMPYPTEGLITAEFIQDKFGVVYNPIQDTQYDLYMKIIESPVYKQEQQIKKALQQILSQQPNQGHDGKQRQGPPMQGQSQKGQGGGQPDGQGGQGGSHQGGQGGSGNQKVTKDYKKGWEQAMEDYKRGRLKI